MKGSYVFCCSSCITLLLTLQATLIYPLVAGVLSNLNLIDCNLENKSTKHFGSELMNNKFAIIILLNYLSMLLLLLIIEL